MLSNHTDYSKFDDATLEECLSQVEIELKNISNQKKQIVETILNRNADMLNDLLSQKEEPYGVVHINNLEITFPKKVTYDETKLAKIAEEIAAAGEKVSDYIEVSYDVKEARYKMWPEPIKAQFIPARTVKQGNPSIKLKEKE